MLHLQDAIMGLRIYLSYRHSVPKATDCNIDQTPQVKKNLYHDHFLDYFSVWRVPAHFLEHLSPI